MLWAWLGYTRSPEESGKQACDSFRGGSVRIPPPSFHVIIKKVIFKLGLVGIEPTSTCVGNTYSKSTELQAQTLPLYKVKLNTTGHF